ncbi:MAG: NTP transferase domain-containing protein [Qingshengfaniella sp.]
MAAAGCAGIVLAAGQSRRFGPANKLLAPLAGRPLACHAAAAMRQAAPGPLIAVVADPAVAALFNGFVIVPPDGTDQSASLRAGIAAAVVAGASGVLLGLADMPRIDAPHLCAVMALGRRLGAAGSSDGVRPMPPAFFAAPYFPALSLITGDRGARTLLGDLPPGALIRVPPGALADIDTPDQLTALDRDPG